MPNTRPGARREATNAQARPAVAAEQFFRHPRPSRAERRADGKARRAVVPLESHAAPPDASARDAIEILGGQDADREATLLPIRYGRMVAGPFPFLRGAAAVMAADLSVVPSTDIEVQLCGDAHLSNFGMFASPDRRLVFDVNDFDETARGPFEWDVKRLAASVAVAASAIGLKDKRISVLVTDTVATYRRTIRTLAEAPTLDVWYYRVDADALTKQLASTALAQAAKKSSAKARRNTGQVAVDKMTETVGGVRRFRDQPPILAPVASSDIEDAAGDLYGRYLTTLPLDCAVLLARYSFRAMAHRVVGVGSVGTRSLVMLLESGDGESLILQLKQAGASVLEAYLGTSRFGDNHGHRVVAGQRLMQAAGDPFLGWADRESGAPHDYYVRQLRDMKGSIDPAGLTPQALQVYARVCAGVLARAHARGGDASQIAGYLGAKETFDHAVAQYAMAYRAVTEADHAALAAAIADGRVLAQAGV